MNLEKELETAVRIAREAGEVINGFYKLEIIAEEKYGVDNFSEPVTIADRTASKLIVENLAEAFPEDAILSEEEPDTKGRLTKKRAWIIDPIDGTKGFINKDGDFAVQIGLAAEGESVLGVVYLPAENALYYAAKGAGSFFVKDEKTPERLEVSDKKRFAEMILAVSRNHRSGRMKRLKRDFRWKGEVSRGSVGLKVGLIARQICDLYIHLSPRTKLWDTCAPEVILAQAGGKLTDLYGAPIRYDIADVQNHNGILATNGVAHEAAVTKIKPLLREFGRLRVKSKAG